MGKIPNTKITYNGGILGNQLDGMLTLMLDDQIWSGFYAVREFIGATPMEVTVH